MTPTGRDTTTAAAVAVGRSRSMRLHDYRMKVAGKLKADQIRDTGAQIVATPVPTARSNLRELMDYYDLPVEIVGVHDLILRAIRLDGNERRD